MSRSQRLLDLIQLLRRYKRPVAGSMLANELGISLRTLYRDIETLKAQGAHIEGEAGLGYLLRPGFMLPPLMFSEEEIEALVLGSRWVSERADGRLGTAARNALTKIEAVLPADLRESLQTSNLLIGPGESLAASDHHLVVIRDCIRAERKLNITYSDDKGLSSQRIIWPFALAFFERVRVVLAWCELRNGYRHFRTDRIHALESTTKRYPQSRASLLTQWRRLEGVREQ